MEMTSPLHESEAFVGELRDCAKLLSEKLNGEDIEGASVLIEQLIEVRDRNIFNQVGQLTRGLHDALCNFSIDGDLNKTPPETSSSDSQDASEHINYVIDMTQKAADKTMDMVEASAPIALSLGQEAATLRQEWARMKRREMTADEFRDVYQRVDDFFGQMSSGTTELNKNLQNIVLEQGFQDLTGQVLKRVISLVKGVEENLVSLVRIAGQVEEITGLVDAADTQSKPENVSTTTADIEAEGPQINADKREDVVSGQDEVDDLLSSLGF